MGQQRCHIRQVARTGGTLQVAAVDKAPVDAADVRIHDRHGLTERKSGDGAGGVVADPRQGFEVGDVAGNLTAMAFHTGDRALLQTQSAPGIAQVGPHS